MNTLKINFASDGCSIDWGASVSGLRLLAQKAAVGVLVDLGSDRSIPTRGNMMTKKIIGVGAYDLQGIQHQLNFAAAKTTRDIRTLSDNTDPTEQIRKVSIKLTGLRDGVVATNIAVTNVAGGILGINLDV